MADEDSRKKYAYLDQLSTEELESILRADLFNEENDTSDLVDKILEVIVRREQGNKDQEYPDVKAAREEFDLLYHNLEAPLYSSKPIEDSSGTVYEPISPSTQPKHRASRLFLRIAVVAAVIAALTMIPAFGYSSILQMVAHWTSSQFGFSVTGDVEQNSSKQLEAIPEEYAELQAALMENGIDYLTVPRYIPEGFQVGEQNLYISPETGDVSFSLLYEAREKYIMFSADQIVGENGQTYEKDGTDVEIYPCHEMEYYIFTNNGTNTVAWCTDRVEYSLTTCLDTSELKEILNSIY